MKLKKLIQELQILEETHGDKDVVFGGLDDSMHPIDGVNTAKDTSQKVDIWPFDEDSVILYQSND